MSEETRHQARAIPASGISGPSEQERRATSTLLVVIGEAPLSAVGAAAVTARTYVEVPFDQDGQRVHPHGLVRVTRGLVGDPA